MDVTPIPKPQKRRRDPEYTAFVAQHPCMMCGRPSGPPHHVRLFGWGCMGRKPDDRYQIPLCSLCHDRIHNKPWEFDSKDILLCILELRERWHEKGQI